MRPYRKSGAWFLILAHFITNGLAVTITGTAGGSSIDSSATPANGNLEGITFHFEVNSEETRSYDDGGLTGYDGDFVFYTEQYSQNIPLSFSGVSIGASTSVFGQGELGYLQNATAYRVTSTVRLNASAPVPFDIKLPMLQMVATRAPSDQPLNVTGSYEDPNYFMGVSPKVLITFSTTELSIPVGTTQSAIQSLTTPEISHTLFDLVQAGLTQLGSAVQGWVLWFGASEVESNVLIPVWLSVDQDHNGEITANDLVANSAQKPFRFQANDDDDSPGSTPQPDYLNAVVDGADDLKDFFPVFLDIKQLIAVLPPSASVKYKLKQEDSGMNFVYTSLTRATAFAYQDATTATTSYGPNSDQSVLSATTQQITATGIELPTASLTRIRDENQGIILVELRGMTAKPLKVVVEKDGTQIAEVAVNIATGEVEWESIDSNNPVEDFNIPASYADYTTKDLDWLEGKRYFVDGASADAQSFRIRINVKVRMAGSGGKTVELKAFDVDDPTPEEWDPDNVVDANDTSGPVGDDNRDGGVYPGDQGSIHEGTFSTAFLKTTSIVLNANGEGKAEFILSQKPGNNYRIAAALMNTASQLDTLQVASTANAGYVTPNTKPVRGFSGIVSPMLTIWRKLHVEIDSMAAIPIEVSNGQKNYATGTIVAEHNTGGPFVSLDLSGTLSDPSRYAELGSRIEIDGIGTYPSGSFSIFEATDSDTVRFYVPEGIPSVIGQTYKIYDDDFEVVAYPLTSMAGPVIDRLKAYYAPAFIDPILAQNPDANVGFVLNQDVPPVFATSVTWNDAQNTEGRRQFFSAQFVCIAA